MPERTLGGRNPGPSRYPVSLLQAAAALYGAAALEGIARPDANAGPAFKPRKASRG
ncbi:hypothetical protein BV96_02846 [Sphingomonas paucimobilis]|nr:hypothetical protein BV96_02846 [Sphingomonas paucimobilis]